MGRGPSGDGRTCLSRSDSRQRLNNSHKCEKGVTANFRCPLQFSGPYHNPTPACGTCRTYPTKPDRASLGYFEDDRHRRTLSFFSDSQFFLWPSLLYTTTHSQPLCHFRRPRNPTSCRSYPPSSGARYGNAERECQLFASPDRSIPRQPWLSTIAVRKTPPRLSAMLGLRLPVVAPRSPRPALVLTILAPAQQNKLRPSASRTRPSSTSRPTSTRQSTSRPSPTTF